MKLLAFDTCWQACSAAVAEHTERGEFEVIAERLEVMTTGQAEVLPVMLSELLGASGLPAQSIDRIAVPNGPGSFTGVRIGIAAARALLLSSPAELVTTSSLHVIAAGLAAQDDVEPGADLVVAMDARRNEVYVQVFSRGRVESPETEPQLLPIPDGAKLAQTDVVVIAGTAADALAREVEKSGRRALVMSRGAIPEARVLAKMAVHLTPRAEPLLPVYLRPPDAKPNATRAIRRTPLEGSGK